MDRYWFTALFTLLLCGWSLSSSQQSILQREERKSAYCRSGTMLCRSCSFIPTDKENDIFIRGVGRNTWWGSDPRSDPKSVVLGWKLIMADGALPLREYALLLVFKIHHDAMNWYPLPLDSYELRCTGLTPPPARFFRSALCASLLRDLVHPNQNKNFNKSNLCRIYKIPFV